MFEKKSVQQTTAETHVKCEHTQREPHSDRKPIRTGGQTVDGRREVVYPQAFRGVGMMVDGWEEGALYKKKKSQMNPPGDEKGVVLVVVTDGCEHSYTMIIK